MNFGFFRVAAAVPAVQTADPAFNLNAAIESLHSLESDGPSLVVMPEMSLSAYTCADLFHNSALLDAVEGTLDAMAAHTAGMKSTVIVGAPLRVDGVLYNCAAVLSRGEIIAVVPKTYIPNYNEFYEKRWWASAPVSNGVWRRRDGRTVPFGTDILVDVEGVKVGIEICEDLWTPVPPSCRLAMAGAEVIVNLSASDDLIGKYDYLTRLIAQQSACCICGYVYASAGYGESSTDLVFDGKAIVAENGSILARNRRWQQTPTHSVADIDIDALRRDRLHIGSFRDCAVRSGVRAADFLLVKAGCGSADSRDFGRTLLRDVTRLPFVPSESTRLDERCEEIISIQVGGLCRRLQFTHTRCLVIGISGGLDSTLALLVAVRAFDRLSLDRKGIIGVTMPGFGTTGRTHTNAIALMEQLGVTSREISIVPAVRQHFVDIGQDPDVHDVTYENSQARERTQLLMDIANKESGMVLGTGDLSELALGWATYNGDHMSMYGVNAGVPKTLVRHLTRYFATTVDSEACRRTLLDIVDTPISPELTPADEKGNIKQKTEDLVGPYELHDFFLYYTLRYGFSPSRIFYLALQAFGDDYDRETLKHWLTTFFRRFFNQQFKRSCLPDGPKVGSVCLSPRGDWRMPSDASSALWLKECAEL